MYVDGVDQGQLVGIRVPDYDGVRCSFATDEHCSSLHQPISDVTSNDIICNGGINPYHTPVPTEVVTVPAGSQVIAEWHHTLNGADAADAADPIDASHKGPVMTYLAKVDDPTSLDVSGLSWFKIQEEGYDASSGVWGVDTLIANDGKVTVEIPACIESGYYLMRHELIALHGASNYPGAQFYMECAQIEITGGGSTSPETVSFPGAYAGSDPGITINIYQTLDSYTVPGPEVFKC